jgi:hypothetical protein
VRKRMQRKKREETDGEESKKKIERNHERMTKRIEIVWKPF